MPGYHVTPFTRRAALLTALLGTAAAGGCSRGPALGDVSGVVTFNGRPVPYAYVVFQPIAPRGTYGSAYADEDGRYRLRFSASRDGAPVGRHRVSITAGRADELPADAPPSSRVRLPAKFNETTELVRDVKPGRNTIDFELTGTPAKEPARPARRVALR